MLRNIPSFYNRRMFLEMLDKAGFAGLYDFVYLPMDFKTRACLGYAFVDLVREDVANFFWKVFDGYTSWVFPSKKVCKVSWGGSHRGLQVHVERYRNSSIMHPLVPEEYRPVLFENGRRIKFPPPTKMPRAPGSRFNVRPSGNSA